MTEIPENFTDFLYWVKERTELFWSIDPKTSSNDFVCEDWIYGAKWIGLSENEIDEIEIRYSIKFTVEHREFLKILHTIDRKERIEYTESFEEDAEVLTDERPFFYHWLKDETEIRERLDWPFKTIYQDVVGVNRVWLKSWGKRPGSEIEIKKIYTDWYKNTPSLIPLRSHRFLVSEPNLKHKPVLSIWGSDSIVYGWSLRSYLLSELQDHLNIKHLIYDDEDKCYYSELIPEVQTIFDRDYTFDEGKTIPNLQEMILFWTSGWSSFGLKYPGEEENKGHPIMKTYIAEDEDNSDTMVVVLNREYTITEPMKNVELFENDRATGYNQFVETWIPNYHYFLDRLPKLVSGSYGKDLLVVGCGTGNEIERFVNTPEQWTITGIDPSPEMIKQANDKLQNYGNVTLINGVVADLDVEKKYSAATLLLVLHFLEDNGNKLSLLKDIADRLVSGATFVMLDITGDKSQIQQNLNVLRLLLPDGLDEEQINNRLSRIENDLFAVSEERLSELLQQAGFEAPLRFFQSSVYMGWLTRKR